MSVDPTGNIMARLQQFYRDTVVPKLRTELGITNAMQIPKIVKITVNMGVGEAVADKKIVEAAAGDLAKITGQKPVMCRSRKSIASFKLRENLPIGCKVTLRGRRMYEFLDRLVSVALPRVRDFRGLSSTATTAPLRPLSRPEMTMTLSPLRILFMKRYLRALPVPAR